MGSIFRAVALATCLSPSIAPAQAGEVPAEAGQAAPQVVEVADPSGAAAAASAARPARQVVADLNDALLTVLKQANELDYAQRFELLAPILADSFDLEYMARQAVGRSFLDLEETQRRTWYRLFKDYMAATYASRFDRYSGQSFEIVGEEPGSRGTVLIRTQVIDPGGENVALSYRLRENGGAWKVADVYLKGTVSELALRRSEYASVLKRDGFDALTADIETKIDDLAGGEAEDAE